jgi:hypothetical protein
MLTNRVPIGTVLFAALLCGTKLAQAEARAPQSLELEMSYHAHPSCPSGSTFLDVLRQHLAAGGEGPVAGDVKIVRRPETADFELRLQLRVSGRDYESVAHARSCEALMRLAALNAAIARTSAVTSSSATRARGEESPEFIPNSPPEALAELDPKFARPDGNLMAAEPAATEAGWQPAGRRWFALAAVRTTDAMLPQRAWGQAAVLGLARAPWSLRLTGTWWQSQRAELSRDGGSPLRLEFNQQSLELSPCWGHELSGLLRVEGCASLAGHRGHTDAPETRFIATLGLGGLVSVRLWQDLHLELGGGLQLAVGAPHYLVRLERVYQPELLEPVAQLALGWEFGAPEPRAATPERAPSLPVSTRRAER